MNPPNLQSEWAWLLFDSLAAAGVRDVVVSPGSRSTPFVLAAAQDPRLRCRHIVDERAAAFFALGGAKVTGRPAVVLCTSGTAAANYFPAVVEAAMSYTPLLLLTADRPTELSHCAAPQTIDQIKLYGENVRHFFELGAPDPGTGALRALRRTAVQAVFASRWPVPGPVHLNARAKKPLEPRPATTDEGLELHRRVRELASREPTRVEIPRLLPAPDAIRALARCCRDEERGLIVAGPAPVSQARCRPEIQRLAQVTGFPVLAEAPSQLRFGPPATEAETPRVDAFDLLLRSAEFRRRHAPALIVQIGAPPTARMWEPFVDEHPGCRRFVLAPHGWYDPTSSATALVVADVEESLRALLESLQGLDRRETPWQRSLLRANQVAWQEVAAELEGDGEELSEGGVARQVMKSLPSPGLLALGNSLPIRQVDTYCPGDGRDVLVWSQRGANGIDGVLSGAAGASGAGASGAGAPRPLTLLVGDVSFLHDLSGLGALAAVEGVPVVVVVVHNDGGRIFEQLPIVDLPGMKAETLDHWLTPHGLSLEPAAHLFHIPCFRVTSPAALDEALSAAYATLGPTVVEAVVPPHSAREQNRRLWQAMERKIREPAP